ncbi:PQQ-binding-like beta-propeller repeat protein [uncultured Friedmanniella sp.]|uniref:outer membrane protein assembly factor BamB family protein n=1 Tax=uncultured Friedmanniella sp. TaxID=335381 RepID=UPI0035CC5083
MVPGPDQPPAAEPRWSPFPVQDWSTLPFDPLVPAPLVPAPLAPGRVGSGPDGRRWWVPLVVLLVVGALLGGLLQRAATPTVAPDVAAQAFLPADGQASAERTSTRLGDRVRVTDTVTESARSSGAAGLLAGDDTFVRHFVRLALDDPELAVWRTTTTPVGGSSAQTTRFYRTDGAVQLLGESRPDGASVFTPALVELPADVAPGRRWSSSGTLGAGRPGKATSDYRSDLHAEAAADGCLLVSGTLTVAGRATPQNRTWCPGQGMVSSGDPDGAVSTVRTAVPLPRPATADVALRWTDPSRWSVGILTTVSRDPTLGTGAMDGSTKPLAPVRTTSGRVVRVLAGGDLVATRPLGGGRWSSVWRARPGGDVVTLAAFADVVVVTTTARKVVAYSDLGVRLWQRALSEIAPSPAVRLTPEQLVLVTLDGRVQVLGIADGAPGWAADVGSDVTLAPVVGSGLVVVGDRGGTTTALEATSGRTRWTTALLATALATTGDAGGTVLVAQDQTVHALRGRDGRHRWLRGFDGTMVGLQPLGPNVVVATRGTSELLGPDGRVLARLDAFVALTPTADHLVGWGRTEASVLDREGRVLVRWPLPSDNTVISDRPATALPDGVLLFALGWTFAGWGP